MANSNLISASLTSDQKTEILKCLTDAQNGLNFLINLSITDKKRLPKMGTRSVGYVDECIAAFDEFRDLLPANLDLNELRKDRALYDDLNTIAVKVRALNEGLQDTLAALSSDLMTTCNDGYAVLRRNTNRDTSVKASIEQIGKRYKANGPRTSAKSAA